MRGEVAVACGGHDLFDRRRGFHPIPAAATIPTLSVRSERRGDGERCAWARLGRGRLQRRGVAAAHGASPRRDGEFEVLFRFYGPEEPLFNKTWTLPDIEKIGGRGV
jgi:hypothetical protein